MKLNTKLFLLICSFVLITIAGAQTTAPARYISPLDCVYKGRVGKKNIVESGKLKFQVSQKGHDEYNLFSISRETEISGINVGSFIFKTRPTREDLGNGAYSKKLHFDIYDYGNLNGNRDRELMRPGDSIYVTFLVKFATTAPVPARGSQFDNDNPKYRRNLFFQFWPGGVVTHLYSYPPDSPEARANKFGYVTVLTADFGRNKVTLSRKFDVQKDRWYRMYFQYQPDVSNGRIFVKMAPHSQGLLTDKMTTLLDLQGNTLYETKSNRRILPTFGNYHWGGSPDNVETHFSEMLVSKAPLQSHTLLEGRASLPVLNFTTTSAAQNPILHWDFENTKEKATVEAVTGSEDALEGNVEIAEGIKGNGLRLDGFTTCLRRAPGNVASPADTFTVEGWVALGNYPWNWCPILTTEDKDNRGYRLMLGPLGQASLQVAAGEEWISCESNPELVPLRQWMHVVGVYRAGKNLELFLNGKLVASTKLTKKIAYGRGAEYRIGMVAVPGKPSDIHRTWGTMPAFYGIDGIIDEIKVYNKALDAKTIAETFAATTMRAADIAPRKLPTIKRHPGRFGAFYTKLEYYPGWDNLWPVEQDPDVVVCFKKSPIKLIFWRGIRYGASWVSENENWMSDQSVESWGTGKNDNEGCFEHMQDRHCRFSHVRIIENTDARVVVHWRYAPVSSRNNTWRPDPKTGWECWVDEYYYVYPDGTGIRRVSWKQGSLGRPRQFQETLALLHPGQKVSDLVEKEVAYVADYEGARGKQLFVEDPSKPPYGPFKWGNTKPYTIQQYNFKSVNKPFICFEPGNKMNLRHNRLSSYDKARGCNHFPVGQARCDGRTTRMADRPSHATSFPISDPVLHEEGDRFYWCALYGMNSMDMDGLVKLGRSWAYAPELSIEDAAVKYDGYDRSRRCYQLESTASKPQAISFTLSGSEDSPIINPAFSVRNWNADSARVLVDGKEFKDCEVGVHHKLEGDDLTVFLWLSSRTEIRVEIK